MSKYVLALIIGAVIVIGGVTYVVTKKDDNTAKLTNTTTGQSQDVKTGSAAFVAVDACDVLTDAAAKAVLGDGATKHDTSAGNASTADISVSNCNYTYKPVTTGSALHQIQNTSAVGVLARAAKSSTGAASNKAVFLGQRPEGAVTVSGYGDDAFFNPKYGQLNILKGNNWYILSHYKGLKPSDGTIDQAKELADAIKDNLK